MSDYLKQVREQDVYDVLVREAGAPDGLSERLQWRHFWPSRYDLHEYRFCGKLGFGGKVWFSRTDGPRVDCYPEDETPERLEVIAQTNRALARLTEEPTP